MPSHYLFPAPRTVCQKSPELLMASKHNIFYVRLDHFPLVPPPFFPTHLEQVPANTVDSRILSIQIYSMNCLVTVNIAKRLIQY